MSNVTQPRAVNAAVVNSHHHMDFHQIQLAAPLENEVGVRIVACGICHTDLGFMTEGAILGHEGAGVVEQVGSAVKSVKPGDHVLLSYQSCGVCAECQDRHPYNCEHFSKLNFGFQRIDGTSAYPEGVQGHFFGQSAFADYCLVTEQNLVKVAPELPLNVLAPLGCGIQTGAGTVFNTLKVKPGESLMVMGTGAVGLAAIMAAKIAGAKTIIAVDREPRRLVLARKLGATESINSDEENYLATLCPHLDYVIDTTGISHLDELGQDVLKEGGTLVRLAGIAGEPLTRGRKAISVIQGDSVAQDFLPKLIEYWQQGRFPLEQMITFYDFDDINRALKEANNGSAVKAVLVWE
ncbi:NAD(P)-dependent alcohol dehydrogenase [Rouxiella badensis]|uniref:NAD(P)-dependent alcohol dehydrogenase n=1 Tax=Rouxiella badensis TaxID=1646377 RepID=UPI0017888099|nr:NAD(P)-dependent alcohol dehydrogenase [Rouxiella badensis]QOI54088.1 NAD(P)-dependent alcohol dehydrogenase [Rouxiella badensis subsp. acadiensis]